MTTFKIRAINLKQIEWAIRACADKRGIEFIVNCHNAAIERGEMDLVFHLPTGEYRRYAHLMADLVNIQKQMNDAWDAMYAEALRMDAAMDPRTDDEGNDPREWSGESIERDHAEALEIEAAELNAKREAIRSGAWVDEAEAAAEAAAVVQVDKAFAAYWNNSDEMRVGAALSKWTKIRDRAHDENVARNNRAAFYALSPFSQQCEIERLRREAIWFEGERVRHEARRIAEVNRAEFWLGNPVTQREDIERAHDAAIAHDAELTEREEANRLGCIADGGLMLPGYALALPNGCLIEMQKGALTGSVVRFLRRGSYFETERDAKGLRDSYRRDAVVIPYAWSFLDVQARAELIKQQEGRK